MTSVILLVVTGRDNLPCGRQSSGVRSLLRRRKWKTRNRRNVKYGEFVQAFRTSACSSNCGPDPRHAVKGMAAKSAAVTSPGSGRGQVVLLRACEARFDADLAIRYRTMVALEQERAAGSLAVAKATAGRTFDLDIFVDHHVVENDFFDDGVRDLFPCRVESGAR